ncbi:hypothetical protein FS837_005458 [Tulasnella sp. UAMH 9824]|nr:hypothetical protein FS837_005458 [Tulasnella sp. UAMH 9824]
MADVGTTIITDDGVTLDRTVLENALKPLAQYFIPKEKLHIIEQPLGRGGYGVVKLAELMSDDQSTGGSVMVAVKVLHRDYETALPLRVAYVRDTLKGLQYLHTRDPPIVHGDLKSPFSGIFGLAGAVRRGGHSGLTTSCHVKGSARWCSPQVLLGYKRTLESDIWGWACLALEIMTGTPPYYDITNEARLILVVCGDPPKRRTPEPTPAPTFPNGLLELLRKCWEFEPYDRPDACTCAAAIIPVPQTEKVRVWKDARWLDSWIMEYIPLFEKAIRGCISEAELDPDIAQKLCQLSSLSIMELEGELRELKRLLRIDRAGRRLPHLTKKYIKVREQTIIKEIEIRPQPFVRTRIGFIRSRSSSLPGRRPKDPVAQVLRAISTLHTPVRLSREQVGEILRELHALLRDEVAPLDKSRYLFRILPSFERLVRHYPDDFHPDVARFLIGVYYEHHIRHGNHTLCLEAASQAAERYRELSRTNEVFLARRAAALGKVVACSEILGLQENARACLEEVIHVYRRLSSTFENHHTFQIPLARAMVRYHQVLCHLGCDWNDSDLVDALRECIKIYNSLIFSGTFTQGSELEQFVGELADALVNWELTLFRKGDRVEALKVEDQLIDIYKILGEEEQATEVTKRRDAMLA